MHLTFNLHCTGVRNICLQFSFSGILSSFCHFVLHSRGGSSLGFHTFLMLLVPFLSLVSHFIVGSLYTSKDFFELTISFFQFLGDSSRGQKRM